MQTMKKAIVLTLLLVGCSGEQLDVGDNGASNNVESGGSGGAGATGGSGAGATGGTGAVGGAGLGGTGGSAALPSGPELPDWSSVGACPDGETLSAFVGTWEGALEDFFLNPLVPLRLTIDDATLDGACGTFTWGVGSPPPPSLTDPNNRGEEFSSGGQTGYGLRDGFTYTILDGAARDETLRVGVTEAEYADDYCASQEEVFYDSRSGQWQCIPPWQSMAWGPDTPGDCTVYPVEGNSISYDMKRCAACGGAGIGFCSCNSTGCAAPATATQLFDFTLERSSTGDRLVMPWESGDRTITLMRVE
jgi:hypothetical protein